MEGMDWSDGNGLEVEDLVEGKGTNPEVGVGRLVRPHMHLTFSLTHCALSENIFPNNATSTQHFPCTHPHTHTTQPFPSSFTESMAGIFRLFLKRLDHTKGYTAAAKIVTVISIKPN